jgi:hypothetical protein
VLLGFVSCFEGQMGQSQTGGVEHAMRRCTSVAFDGQNRQGQTGVVVAWPSAPKSTAVPAAALDHLEAENADLRRQVVELALAIQDLRDEVRGTATG